MSDQKSRGFLGSVLTLMSGNVLAQGLTMACTPVLTRLFPPEAYGEFALASSIIMVLASVSHLRYNAAIMLPRAEEDADALTLLSLGLVAGVSLLALALVLLLPHTLQNLFGLRSVGTLRLVPPGCLLCGGILVLQIRNLRQKRFRRQAAAQFAGAAGSRALIILAGLCGLTAPVVLAAMKPLNDFFLFSVLAAGEERGLRGRIFSPTSLHRVPAVAREYARFPKYCGTDLVLVLNMELPTFLLAVYFSPVEVGLYNLAVRMLKQPSVIIGQAIGRSIYQHTSEQQNLGQNIDGFVLRVLECNLILYLFPAILLWAYVPELFGLIFGAKWSASGEFVRILLPVFLMTFLSFSTEPLMDTLRLQRERFLFSVLQISVSLASFILGAALGDVTGALVCLSGGSSLLIAFRIGWVAAKTGVTRADLIRRTLPPVLASALLGGMFFAADALAGARLSQPLHATIPLALLLLAIYFYGFYALRFRALLRERRDRGRIHSGPDASGPDKRGPGNGGPEAGGQDAPG
ncbi:MAG: lipopolysaccharide biosynthesis protein [Desulfovibrio sp.]